MAIFAAGLASPYVLILMIPCGIIFLWSVKLFLQSARVLKRLDSKTRSPIFGLFNIIYSGLPTIRAFNKQNIMLERGFSMIDINSRMSIMYQCITRWMAFKLDLIISILTFTTSLLCILLSNYYDNISSAAVGLVLTYMITLSTYLQRTVRQAADLESYMTSTERIVEYKDIIPENGYKYIDSIDTIDNIDNIDDIQNKQLKQWPNSGKIEIKNLYCKYREHLDFVLNDINITINNNEKIGIIGRTGSGKSSLILTLIRFVFIFTF